MHEGSKKPEHITVPRFGNLGSMLVWLLFVVPWLNFSKIDKYVIPSYCLEK